MIIHTISESILHSAKIVHNFDNKKSTQIASIGSIGSMYDAKFHLHVNLIS